MGNTLGQPQLIAASLPKISSCEPGGFVPWNNGESRGHYDLSAIWRESGVPDRHKSKVRERDNRGGKWGAAYEDLKHNVDRGDLIVLLGKRGTGKTQMAVDLLAFACMQCKTVRYLKAMDLFREIRSCYRPDGPDEVKTVNALCRFGAMVIDEAHERSDSEWENRTLTNIIDRRYDAQRCTILASNMTREAFAAAVGPSIVSRVHESGKVVECDWESFR